MPLILLLSGQRTICTVPGLILCFDLVRRNTTVQFAYDNRGRRTSVTDQNNKVTTYAYDDADRLTSVTDAANHVTRYTYDNEHNVTDIYDAANNHTQFVYYSGSTFHSTTFPSGYSESYTWDTAMRMNGKTDRNDNEDAGGRAHEVSNGAADEHR